MTIKTEIQSRISNGRRIARNKRYKDKRKKLNKESTMYKKIKETERKNKLKEKELKEREEVNQLVNKMRSLKGLTIEIV